MAQITYYFSLLSPFTYLAGSRLEEIAARHQADVTYKPFDIMALFARTGGTPLPQRHPSRVEYRAQDLTRRAKLLNMPFNLKPAHWPTNPAPASYALIAAQKAGGDVGGLTQALLRAVWADEQDIADDAVIKACLSESGFDPGLTESGLLSGAETYAQNLEDAVSAGVFGSPFYILDTDDRFHGQDRLADLEACLAGEYE
jgi:2-hydroxychromene-2-carboxylate isomerase